MKTLRYAAAAAFLVSAVSTAGAATNGVWNPYGTGWANATESPANWLIVGGAGCYRASVDNDNPPDGLTQFDSDDWVLDGDDHRLDSDQSTFLGTTGFPYIWASCAQVLEFADTLGRDRNQTGNYATYVELKAHFDDIIAAIQPDGGKLMAYWQLTVHANGSPGWRTAYYDPTLDYWVPNSLGSGLALDEGCRRIFDITDPDFQDFFAANAAASFDYYGLNAILFDNVMKDSPATSDGSNPNCATATAIANATKTNWSQGWADLFEKVRAAIDSNQEAWVNVGKCDSAQQACYDHVDRLLDTTQGNVTGIMCEDCFGPRWNDLNGSNDASGRLYNTYIEFLDMVKQYNKKMIITAEPGACEDGARFDNQKLGCAGETSGMMLPAYACDNNECPHDRPFEADEDSQRDAVNYYSAAWQIFRDGNYVYFNYDDPTLTSDQYRSSPWHPIWRRNLGSATGAWTFATADNEVYQRTFNHGKAFLNNRPCLAPPNDPDPDSDGYAVALGTSPKYYNTIGTQTNVIISCKKGMVYFKGTAFDPPLP